MAKISIEYNKNYRVKFNGLKLNCKRLMFLLMIIFLFRNFIL